MTQRLALSYPHGGMVGGVYQTNGKEYTHTSVDPPLRIMEGVQMRKLCCMVADIAIADGCEVWDVPQMKRWQAGTCWHDLDQKDLGPSERARRANRIDVWPMLELHSDAVGNELKGKGHSANGCTGFTSPGQTGADKVATGVLDSLRGHGYKIRPDYSDGDPDKEARYAVLLRTRGAALLLETGFHTNIADALRLTDGAELQKLAQAIWDGLK